MSFETDEIEKMAEFEIAEYEHLSAQRLLEKNRIAVFVVAYNAERHLSRVVQRIPGEINCRLTEIFVIDDNSTDGTYDAALRIKAEYPHINFQVYRTPFNRGYGGNQKLGYLYCLEKGYDYVVLLHGDGQYAPEYLSRVLAVFDDTTDAVFASRMIDKRRALKGGMPFYKWVGNQLLTKLQNLVMGTRLTEFHTGFRAYRVESLKKVPFAFNSDGFHFDTEIIVQAVASNWKIKEVSIPAHYGDEKCHVAGIRYAWNCIKAVTKYHLVNGGLFYERNLDLGAFEADNYQFKKSPNSLHQFVLRKGEFGADTVSIELGANRGILSSCLAKRVKRNTAVDIFLPDSAGDSQVMAMDLNEEFSGKLTEDKYDCCLALDVIEHMDVPENFLNEVFKILKANGKLYISTANIAYFPLRLMLLLGQFNYGKRGILDKTHKRLFTIRSFRKLLIQYNFEIEYIKGFSPPVADLISSNKFMRFVEKLHALLSSCFPKLFAYNFLVVARRMDDINDIFAQTIGGSRNFRRK
jgi:glycosyltransferase involved in cell wall biosynthesis